MSYQFLMIVVLVTLPSQKLYFQELPSLDPSFETRRLLVPRTISSLFRWAAIIFGTKMRHIKQYQHLLHI